MPAGKVVAIHIAAGAAEPPRAVDEVRAEPGRGLEGDRYYLRTGTYSKKWDPGREVTLIEIETLEALARDFGIELAPAPTRRNLVTRGVALNHLVSRRFRVGEVELEGVRLCEPCGHLERLTVAGTLRALVHRGGLRARIVTGGLIRAGDPVQATEEAKHGE